MTSNKDILDGNPMDLVVSAEVDMAISTWSESKKIDFVGTFDKRCRAGRYLLEATAEYVKELALNRRYIGQKNLQSLKRAPKDISRLCDSTLHRYAGRHGYPEDLRDFDHQHVGGRETSQLDELAKERAREILDELPPLRTAVALIDADLAKKIDKKDALKKRGQALTDQLMEASEPILMSEMKDDMTVKQFRAYVAQREKARVALVTEIHDVSKEGQELEVFIAKRLYSGLPGLSDAVIQVIQDHWDRSTALDETGRRVEEQVKYGDSQAALEILRHFEGDEVQVPQSIKSQFAAALEALKLSAKKASKKAQKQVGP